MESRQGQVSRFSNFHIMFFAIIMGLGGLSIAYRAISGAFALPQWIFEILRYFALGVFVAITALYLAKLIKFTSNVKKEFSHPIKLNFFAAFPISLLLLSVAFNDIPIIHTPFFYSGVVLQAFITLYIVSFWVKNNMMIQHSNPAWFIPVVGNLIVVLAANSQPHFLWYFFSVGIFFWIVLFTIVFYRIVFHDQLAGRFMPTFFIMIAPPAIAFLDYIKLTGSYDAFAMILLNLTVFFVLLVFFLYRNFFGLKFFLSWWAFTFPTAAASIAFTKAYEITGEASWAYFGIAMFVVLVALVIVVSYFTIKGFIKGEICVED